MMSEQEDLDESPSSSEEDDSNEGEEENGTEVPVDPELTRCF